MNYLAKVKMYLQGRKTHIVAVLFALFNLLTQEGYLHLSSSHVQLINAVLAAAGLSALRAGINKV